ncbi:MAG: hypothetical protein [Bacteriophage sp.]|nr:MAG: hypothetical protein [Bacteriophage sp.]
MMKNSQPKKVFLTTNVLRNILNDDAIKEKNLQVVFADYPIRNDELAAELLNIVGFTVDGRKEVINELVIYADRYEVPTPQKSKNPNKKIPSIPPENEDTWEEVESLENKDPFSF